MALNLTPITFVKQDWFDPGTPRSVSPTTPKRRGFDPSPPPRRSRASVLRLEHVLARHGDSVLAMVVSRRTNHLFSGDQDGLIIVWELSTFSFECELIGHRRPVTSMVLSVAPIMCHHILVTSSRDNTIRIWDAVRMTALAVLDRMSCCALDLVLNQGRLIAACLDTRIAVLDLGAILESVAVEDASPETNVVHVEFANVAECYSGHLGFVYALVVTKSQLFSASGDFNIGVWSLSPISFDRSLQGHTDSVTALDVIDDTYLISGSRDGTIKVWGLPACHLIRSVDAGAPVVCICVTAWTLFVSTTNNIVQSFDLQTFRPIPKSRIESSDTTLYMCADRQFLFTCGTDNTVVIWRSEMGATDLARLPPPTRISSLVRGASVSDSVSFAEVLVAAGAEKYAGTFAENEIDYDALLLLNDRDLEEIGIPLGTRRKIITVADRILNHAQRNSNDDDLIHFLQRLVSHATVSSDPMRRADAWNCARLIELTLMGLGAETRLRQVNSEANPILIAQFASVLPNLDRRKLVFYAHYDVVAAVAEHWSSPPFELSGRNGYLYGRGASDNKGPLAAFVAAIKEVIYEDGGVPIDVALILDGEAETDPFAGGLPTAVLAAMDWLSQPSLILLANTTWSGQERPCLNYGTRGVLEMEITVSGPSKDLHSGVHGGAFHEPMIDLAHVLATLVDSNGRVRIDGFYDSVAPLEPDEAVLYEDLDFDLDGYRNEIGVDRLRQKDVAGHLQAMWRQPCLSIHAIKGGERARSLHSIISGSVSAEISMRLVPNQSISRIAELFQQHVQNEFVRLQSSNSVSVCVRHQGNWWLGNPKSEVYQAAADAVEQIWHQKPSMIREGGTMPTIRFLEDALNAPAVHLAFGQASDQSHLENERIRIKNLIRGRDVFKAFVRSIARAAPDSPSETPASIAKVRSDPRCLSVVGPNHIVIRQATIHSESIACNTPMSERCASSSQ